MWVIDILVCHVLERVHLSWTAWCARLQSSTTRSLWMLSGTARSKFWSLRFQQTPATPLHVACWYSTIPFCILYSVIWMLPCSYWLVQLSLNCISIKSMWSCLHGSWYEQLILFNCLSQAVFYYAFDEIDDILGSGVWRLVPWTSVTETWWIPHWILWKVISCHI